MFTIMITSPLSKSPDLRALEVTFESQVAARNYARALYRSSLRAEFIISDIFVMQDEVVTYSVVYS